MDPKNQNLKPELKEIYDKIMSTPVNSGASTQTPSPAQVTQPSEPVVPSTPPPQSPSMPSVGEPTPPMSQPMTSEPASAIPPTPPAAPAPSGPVVNPPEMNTPMGVTLPINDKGFVYSGGETSAFTPTGSETPAAPKKGLGKVSGKLLTVLIIAFVATYTVIWLKLFNFF